MYEHGPILWLYRELPTRIISQVIEPVTLSTTRKLSNKIEEDETEIIPIGIGNTHRLFQVFLLMISFSLIVLVSEILHGILDRRRKKKVELVNLRRRPRKSVFRRRGPSFTRVQARLGSHYATLGQWKPTIVTTVTLRKRRQRWLDLLIPFPK